MQKIYSETLSLDQMAREKYGLSEEIMMENAANAVVSLVRSLPVMERAPESPLQSVIIFCGSGNNGADGYAIARMLQADFKVTVAVVFPAKSDLAKLQKLRAEKTGVSIISMDLNEVNDFSLNADIYIDAILGASQQGELASSLQELISQINQAQGIKIAVDLPTGMENTAFIADYTVTMGALKESLYLDLMKDRVGKIQVANLGIVRQLYENETTTYLLEAQDLRLPLRTQRDTHKGSFGFATIIKGEQAGASLLSAKAAMRFGAGITALVGEGDKPLEIMQMPEISPKTTAIAAGMGLGKQPINLLEIARYPLVLDADLLGLPEILPLLEEKADCIVTPHPQEFCRLLQSAGMGEYSVTDVQRQRLMLARQFSQAFRAVLVLKGANTIIAQNGVLYICDLGTAHLAKGGSGDVLAGMMVALLAQGYSALTAAKQAVLAHAIAAKNLKIHDYAMTPLDLIEALKDLK